MGDVTLGLSGFKLQKLLGALEKFTKSYQSDVRGALKLNCCTQHTQPLGLRMIISAQPILPVRTVIKLLPTGRV